MADPGNPLFDDSKTPEVEKRDDIIRRSLSDAIALLGKQCGSNIENWQWGCLHTVSFNHQPFSTVPVLKMIFNGPTLPARGDRFTVDAAAYNASQPYVMIHGSSQRLIVDLSNLNNSLGILTTGETQQIFSAHRFDMVQKWENVEYDPLFFTQELAQANSEGTLMLVPSDKK